MNFGNGCYMWSSIRTSSVHPPATDADKLYVHSMFFECSPRSFPSRGGSPPDCRSLFACMFTNWSAKFRNARRWLGMGVAETEGIAYYSRISICRTHHIWDTINLVLAMTTDLWSPFHSHWSKDKLVCIFVGKMDFVDMSGITVLIPTKVPFYRATLVCETLLALDLLLRKTLIWV